MIDGRGNKVHVKREMTTNKLSLDFYDKKKTVLYVLGSVNLHDFIKCHRRLHPNTPVEKMIAAQCSSDGVDLSKMSEMKLDFTNIQFLHCPQVI